MDLKAFILVGRPLLQFAALYALWVLLWQLTIAVNISLTPSVPWFVGVALAAWWYISRLFLKGYWPETAPLERISTPAMVFAAALIPFLVSVFVIQAEASQMKPMGPLPSPDGASVSFSVAFSIFAPVLIGMVEEVGFRGIIQRTFAERFGAARGILATSALFVLWHFFSPLFSHQYIGYLLTSLLLGYLAAFSGSLTICIVVHAAINLIMNTYVTVNGTSPATFSTVWVVIAVAVLAVSLGAIIASGRALRRYAALSARPSGGA